MLTYSIDLITINRELEREVMADRGLQWCIQPWVFSCEGQVRSGGVQVGVRGRGTGTGTGSLSGHG